MEKIPEKLSKISSDVLKAVNFYENLNPAPAVKKTQAILELLFKQSKSHPSYAHVSSLSIGNNLDKIK